MKYKIIKKMLIVMAASLVLSTTVFAKGVNIKVDGVLQTLELNSQVVNDTVMVDVKALAKLLKADIVFSNNSNTVKLTRNKNIVVLDMGKKEFTVNGQQLMLSVEPQHIEQNIYVPLRIVAQKLGAEVNWIGSSSTVAINTGNQEIKILDLKENVKPSTTVYTYDQGLGYVYEMNSALRNLRDSKALLNEQESDLKDARVEANPLQPDSGDQVIQIDRNLKQIEYQKENMPDQEMILKAGLEQQYRSFLNNIIQSELDIQGLEESIQLGKINIGNLEVKNNLGMVSAYDLTTAKEQLKQNQNQLDAKQRALQSQREAINLFLKMNADTDLFIDYDAKITPVSDNVEQHIALKLKDDPQLRIKDRALKMAEYNKSTTNDNLNETKLQLENNIVTLQRQYSDLTLNYTQKLYDTYNQMKQLELQQESQEINYKIAKDAYNKVVVNFEAGMATMYEVQQAKINLLNSEITMAKNKYQHDNLVFLYERPYLLYQS